MPNLDGSLTAAEKAKLAEYHKNKGAKGKTSATSNDPTDWSEKKRLALGNVDKVVSTDQYNELADLYKKAQISSKGNINLKTPETLAFQKKYHEYLPNKAKEIIAQDYRRTNKGKELNTTSYDLASNEDSMFGPRTEQYWQSLKKPEAAIAKTDTPAGDIKKDNGIIPPVYPRGNDPWWLQDVVKTAGAAGDMFRVKKYNPWQATPGVTLPDTTFYDPTRELAANAEQMNIMSQGLSTFTGPQSYMANMSAVQGQGAKNAADIMGRYNNLNVGLANSSSASDANTLNQAAFNKAGLDTQLFDKYTIANQQFDNSKNMARQNLRQSYMDAVTNKNYTGNLNALYPQYHIDPSIGGRINFTHGRPNTPEMPEDKIAQINHTANQLKLMNPDLTTDQAVKHAMNLHGAAGNNQHDEKLSYLQAMMSGQMGQRNMGQTGQMEYP